MKNATSLKKNVISKTRSFFTTLKFFIGFTITIASIVFIAFSFFEGKTNTNKNHKLEIIPPIQSLDIKPVSYTVDAEKGDTYTYKSGTQIIIPKECFVDENGNKLKGNVNIQYREFSNTADILLSGIPMGYDSGGVRNYFESAGMIEIKGFQNNKLVFINPNKAISLNMASHVEKPGINLYRFDTLKNNWIMLGKDSLNDAVSEKAGQYFLSDKTIAPNDSLKMAALNFIKRKQEKKKMLQLKPIEPMLVNSNKSNFVIAFDKEEFKELCSFENVKFEICDSTVNITNQDTATIWEDVRVERESKSTYSVFFSTTERSIKYIVTPVFDKANIENAKLIFQEKYKQYNAQLKENKIAAEKAQKELTEKLLKAQQEAAAAKIKELKEEKLVEIQNKKAFQEALLKLEENQKKQLEMANMLNAVTRSFEVNKFGIYNSDRLINDDFKKYFLNVEFENNEEKNIKVLYILYKDINVAIKCYSNPWGSNTFEVPINIKEKCKLLAILESDKIGICLHNELLENIEHKNDLIKLELQNMNIKNQDDFQGLVNL